MTVWDNVDNLEAQDYDFRGSVAGVSFVEGYPANLLAFKNTFLDNKQEILAAIKRNPENPYDSNACEVWAFNGFEYVFIGHLPKDIAAMVAFEIDNGATANTEIVSIGFANNDPSKPGAIFRLKLER